LETMTSYFQAELEKNARLMILLTLSDMVNNPRPR